MSGLSRKNTAVNFCFHPLCSLGCLEKGRSALEIGFEIPLTLKNAERRR